MNESTNKPFIPKMPPSIALLNFGPMRNLSIAHTVTCAALFILHFSFPYEITFSYWRYFYVGLLAILICEAFNILVGSVLTAYKLTCTEFRDEYFYWRWDIALDWHYWNFSNNKITMLIDLFIHYSFSLYVIFYIKNMWALMALVTIDLCRIWYGISAKASSTEWFKLRKFKIPNNEEIEEHLLVLLGELDVINAHNTHNAHKENEENKE